MRLQLKTMRNITVMMETLVNKSFAGVQLANPDNRARVLTSYREHEHRILTSVPPPELLVMNMSEPTTGHMATLCNFLGLGGKACTESYGHANRRESFIRNS